MYGPKYALQHRNRRRLPHHIPLQHFLRIIAGGHLAARDLVAESNEELVQLLQQSSNLQSENVAFAMKLCPRDLFIPDAYRQEAFIDSPIRVEEHDFNISAPHMHAACLEALEVCPGMSVLDVGTGCGIMAAYLAVMVGSKGSIVGIDIRRDCVAMARESVQRLGDNRPE